MIAPLIVPSGFHLLGWRRTPLGTRLVFRDPTTSLVYGVVTGRRGLRNALCDVVTRSYEDALTWLLHDRSIVLFSTTTC